MKGKKADNSVPARVRAHHSFLSSFFPFVIYTLDLLLLALALLSRSPLNAVDSRHAWRSSIPAAQLQQRDALDFGASDFQFPPLPLGRHLRLCSGLLRPPPPSPRRRSLSRHRHGRRFGALGGDAEDLRRCVDVHAGPPRIHHKATRRL